MNREDFFVMAALDVVSLAGWCAWELVFWSADHLSIRWAA